ncbi:Arc family DNA binding domain-containing protein [bacterium]|nr:Arc family DNA binding domain-containing protein [bacterium]
MASRKTFLLRISPELWDELNRWAAEELRSVNGQIEYLLREAVKARRGKDELGEQAKDGEGQS